MGQPLRTAATERCLLELARPLCVLQRAEPEKPLGGAQEIMSGSEMLDTELFIPFEFGFWFVQFMTVSWFFPLEVRKYLICF